MFFLFYFFLFYFFCFSLHKLVDSEYNRFNYKSLKIRVEAIIENLEMLRFVPDHLNTKTMCKYAVKKLPFLIRYFPGRYKTHEMCKKTILEIGGILNSVSDSYKNKKSVINLLIIIHKH